MPVSVRSVVLVSALVAGVAAADPTGRVIAPAADDALVLSSAPDTTHPDWGLRSGADAAGVYRSFVRLPLPRSVEIVSAVLELGYAQFASLGPGGQIIDFVPDDSWSQQEPSPGMINPTSANGSGRSSRARTLDPSHRRNGARSARAVARWLAEPADRRCDGDAVLQRGGAMAESRRRRPGPLPRPRLRLLLPNCDAATS